MSAPSLLYDSKCTVQRQTHATVLHTVEAKLFQPEQNTMLHDDMMAALNIKTLATTVHWSSRTHVSK